MEPGISNDAATLDPDRLCSGGPGWLPASAPGTAPGAVGAAVGVLPPGDPADRVGEDDVGTTTPLRGNRFRMPAIHAAGVRRPSGHGACGSHRGLSGPCVRTPARAGTLCAAAGATR